MPDMASFAALRMTQGPSVGNVPSGNLADLLPAKLQLVEALVEPS
jgi:hypothetical protein